MIIVDVEIEKAIPSRNEAPVPGIEYCEGWRDFAGMGLSVVCTYDITTHLSRVFLKEDLSAFADYIRGKPTAGFNTKRFDLPLLREHGVAVDFGPSAQGMHYDILEAIWLSLDLDPDKFNYRTHGGWGLDAVCQATLGIAKTGHGALAPVWWQQGQRGKVIDYCLNDVWMEGQFLLHILRTGWVQHPKDPTRKQFVRLPNNVRYLYRVGTIQNPYTPLHREAQAAAYEEVEGKPLQKEPVDEPLTAPAERSPGGLGIIR